MDNPQPPPGNPRLSKYLALTLGVSRREADSMIEHGTVSINGAVAELGRRTAPDDIIAVNGKTISGPPVAFEYLALNKPVGYVSSRRQQGDSPTIYSVLPQQYHALKPVGRLDRDSSGLLLLTNDGDFAHSMTHPKFYKTKRYEVELDHPLEPLHQQMISDYGVTLPDGPSRFTVTRREDRPGYEVIMHEGRNRQIRRTFDALGYFVTRLHRTDFGHYTLGTLDSGHWEIVTRL
jgi:23S rRNA pseudouridine2605 synthase